MTAFEEMGVLPEIAKAVDEMEWTLPTDVQAEAIPLILGGGDVLMAAETGSGKTGAFCLPVLQIVWEAMKDVQSGKTSKSGGGGKQFSDFKNWSLNVFDRGDAMAIAEDGLLCQSRDAQKWHGARATRGVVGKGKYCFEATVTDDGLCRVGWATLDASLDLGTDDQSFGYGGTGKKSHKKQFDDYGEAFGLQDTIGCFLDLDSGEITFSRNGKKFPTAFKIPPKLLNSSFFPAVVLKNAEIKFNFGAEKFKFDPGVGFVAVCYADDAFSISSSKHGSSVPAVSHRRQAQSNNSPRCIIIEPSRELAQQTHDQMEKFQKYLDVPKIRSCLIVGGVAAKEQMKELSSGVEIVTGTPGRLSEFIQNGNLDLSQVRFFVLDEADGLLSQGHGDLIRSVHKSIPKVTPEGHRLQMIVCSATLHNFDVKKLADQLMHFPQWVDLKGQDSVPETVHHVVCMIDPRTDKRWINMRQHIETDGIHYNDEIRPGTQAAETLSEAVKILKGDYVVRAIREHNMDQSLIFCRTKLDCDNMEKYLNQQSRTRDEFSCVCLHSDRRPDERKENLELFKTRKVKFLICTDVAARGIDVHGMPYVINVTLPDDKSNYLHRIGRVGRAERMGLAISLVSAVQEKVWYHQCPNRGKNCYNTKLKDHGGCSIWYNEPSLLAEIEDHLGVTIQQIETDMKVQTDEFDGKVVYGQKKRGAGSGYQGHAGVLAGAVQELAELEKCVQTSYWNLKSKKILTC